MLSPIRTSFPRVTACLLLAAASQHHAQTADVDTPSGTVNMDAVIISAPKIRQDLLDAPLSATVATADELQARGVTSVKDAAFLAPNTFFTELSPRKLSNPRMRGVGGSPFNPGVTTYYDGVPQFNGNSSSLELVDVEQIDFVRGPLGALFGRNTAGGLVNISSKRPSLNGWHGSYETTFGNYNLFDNRGSITGPLIEDQLGFSFAGGYRERDGYVNDVVSGTDIDNRSAYFGKAQFLWTPSDDLEVRLIITGETANDGDYGLSLVPGLVANPRTVARTFVGYTERDVIAPTLQITYHADSFDFTSTTGFVHWSTTDFVDGDYSAAPFPSLVRSNLESMQQWTQEFRFSNPEGELVPLADEITLSWQAGVFLFLNNYDQTTSTNNVPVSPFVNPQSGTADFSDRGIGIFAATTLSFWEKLDLGLGLRWDYEDKRSVGTFQPGGFFPAPVAPAVSLGGTSSFNHISPTVSLAWHFTPSILAYAQFSGGYKAGGFNQEAPAAASLSYGKERSWNYEAGIKGRVLEDKLSFRAAVFHTDWRNLQLNSPSPVGFPGSFFIANAGNASATGLELDFNYQASRNVGFFGGFSLQDTQFLAGATDNGLNVAGNDIPYSPDYILNLGSQLSFDVGGGAELYARLEFQFMGDYEFDPSNRAGQDAILLANFRLGARKGAYFVEGFVNNALDEDYIGVAFPTPAGFLGENAAPATFGVRAGFTF